MSVDDNRVTARQLHSCPRTGVFRADNSRPRDPDENSHVDRVLIQNADGFAGWCRGAPAVNQLWAALLAVLPVARRASEPVTRPAVCVQLRGQDPDLQNTDLETAPWGDASKKLP
jgi:hypothetical protein